MEKMKTYSSPGWGEGGHVEMEGESGVTARAKDTWGHRKLEDARRHSAQRAGRERGPADT